MCHYTTRELLLTDIRYLIRRARALGVVSSRTSWADSIDILLKNDTACLMFGKSRHWGEGESVVTHGLSVTDVRGEDGR